MSVGLKQRTVEAVCRSPSLSYVSYVYLSKSSEKLGEIENQLLIDGHELRDVEELSENLGFVL